MSERETREFLAAGQAWQIMLALGIRYHSASTVTGQEEWAPSTVTAVNTLGVDIHHDFESALV